MAALLLFHVAPRKWYETGADQIRDSTIRSCRHGQRSSHIDRLWVRVGKVRQADTSRRCYPPRPALEETPSAPKSPTESHRSATAQRRTPVMKLASLRSQRHGGWGAASWRDSLLPTDSPAWASWLPL